jgi:hypothetical protein
MKALDNFYEQLEEPMKGCLLALKSIILKQDSNITPEWKYKVPCFCYKGKMFCYLWIHKKMKQPYIGIVEGKYFDEPFLVQEKRSRIKIMLFDPVKDIPMKSVESILQKALNLYMSGTIKIKGG